VELRTVEWEENALVFTTVAGTPLDPNNVRRRMLKLLAEEAGASWAGFHTLSHAFAHVKGHQESPVVAR